MIGKLWQDSFGNHSCAEALVGQAMWDQFDVELPTLEDRVAPGTLHALLLSVPPGLHGAVVWGGEGGRALASFLPLRKDGGGVGFVTLSTPQEAVVAVLDIGGRQDLGELRQASQAGKVCAVLVTAGEPEISPWVRLSGLTEALDEAAKARRLTAAEFVGAVEEVRWLLRSDALFPMLGLPKEDPRRGASPALLKCLALNVCQPL